MNKSPDFILEVCDVSSTEACVLFENIPYSVDKRQIEYFELALWEEGSTRTIEDIRKIGNDKGIRKPKFEVEIEGNQADAYTLHNLHPATVYKVQVKIFVIDNSQRKDTLTKAKKQSSLAFGGDFAPPEKKKITFKTVESQPLLFNTN